MAATMVAKSSSSSTRSAASRATSVPCAPIATPMSASRSAGASFTPSPVIATTWPARLQRAGDAQLVLGCDPGDHHAVSWSSSSARCCVVVREVAPSSTVPSGVRAGRPRSAMAPGGRGVVAGDHRDPDAGPRHGAECSRHVRAGRVLQGEQTEELEVVLHSSAARPSASFARGDGEHAQSARQPAEPSCTAVGVVPDIGRGPPQGHRGPRHGRRRRRCSSAGRRCRGRASWARPSIAGGPSRRARQCTAASIGSPSAAQPSWRAPRVRRRRRAPAAARPAPGPGLAGLR